MKRSRFSEEQIIGILKEHEAGVSVADLCRKHGVSAMLDNAALKDVLGKKW
jgi:transposase-like protein